MTVLEDQLKAALSAMGGELDRRAAESLTLDAYYEGKAPMPAAVTRARVTNAYRLLNPLSDAPWGSLVVDSVLDRLEPTGIRSGDSAADDACWGVWADNHLDSESKLAHNSVAVTGRAFALVWPDAGGTPTVWLDGPGQMAVRYAEGSRRVRTDAMRRWIDGDDVPHAFVYRPDGIYRFRADRNAGCGAGTEWKRDDDHPDGFETSNPWSVVPVVELAINRRLKPGCYPYARGTYANCVGLLDRINLLTFLGLVVAFWQGFPLRGVIGDKITREVLKDDAGVPILEPDGVTEKVRAVPPFTPGADQIFQLEDPGAKIAEYGAADRGNLSITAELAQLAMITKTPRHYFPQDGGLSNISADTIRADEGAMAAQVGNYQGSLGDGWEDVLRLGGLMLETPVLLSPRAALQWRDHESRSLAERADAATKLKEILPWQALAESVLNASQADISRWETMRASEGFGALVAAASQPVPMIPEPMPAGNGNGAG